VQLSKKCNGRNILLEYYLVDVSSPMRKLQFPGTQISWVSD